MVGAEPETELSRVEPYRVQESRAEPLRVGPSCAELSLRGVWGSEHKQVNEINKSLK